MNEHSSTPIRFTRLSPYGAVGEINSTYDYGLRATLVEAGRAEWVEDQPEQTKNKKPFYKGSK